MPSFTFVLPYGVIKNDSSLYRAVAIYCQTLLLIHIHSVIIPTRTVQISPIYW